VALGGLLTLSAAPSSSAAVAVTNFGFEGFAYGSMVKSGVTGLESAKSAHSWINCTRLVGRHAENAVADINLPDDQNPMITIEGVHSENDTWRDKAKSITGGMTSTNAIAKVRLGDSTTPRLTLNGLRSTSKVWWSSADRKFHTSNKLTSGSLSLVNLPDDIPPELAGPLNDLLDGLNGGINDVVDALQENNDAIIIPGLGVVRLAEFDRQVRKPGYAVAGSAILKIKLYGPDGVQGGTDNSDVRIGRSWAKMTKDVPSGVMNGDAYGATASVIAGALKVGKLGVQPLPCNGTDGAVLAAPVAGLNLLAQDQIIATGVQGRASGLQKDSGAAWAWTEGSVTNFTLGPLEIRGIVGRANVAQNKLGDITARDIKGSSIGEILVDGESQGSFDPSTAGQIPPLEIPGVAKIEFFQKDKTSRGMRTSAVVISLLDNTPGVTEVRLGNANVQIKKY
jgi:hypothetical protein